MHCLSLASASDIAPPASIQLCDCASHVHQYVGGGVKESGAGVGGGGDGGGVGPPPFSPEVQSESCRIVGLGEKGLRKQPGFNVVFVRSVHSPQRWSAAHAAQHAAFVVMEGNVLYELGFWKHSPTLWWLLLVEHCKGVLDVPKTNWHVNVSSTARSRSPVAIFLSECGEFGRSFNGLSISVSTQLLKKILK